MALPLSYHWKNLLVRKTTTLLTVLVIAAVVGVFTWMMGFATALRGSLSQAQDDGKILVLRRGSTSESNSAIPVDDFNKLNQLAGVACESIEGRDEPLISPEMVVQISRPRLRDGGATWSNLALRGVTPTAFRVHTNVKPTGRIFDLGAREVIVGQAAARQFSGLNLGDTLELGYGNDRGYRIVGFFTADGGPAESEVWGYLPSLMNAYNRSMYSSVALRLRDGAGAAAAIEQIEGPAIQLSAHTEGKYWSAQTQNMRVYLMIVRVLVIAMSLAAVFSIANTMFSLVAGRTREIAMLRTIGFAPKTVLWGFVIESVFLSVLGGVAGILGCAAWLRIAGNAKDMFGANTFTTLAFEIHVTAVNVVCALGTVVLIGVLGAWIPARRAARIAVISALREP
jgi:ABC-type lipoprotein release transport system permease subunit